MTPYYQDDYATIYHGDCRGILPDVDFDVLISDPPYGGIHKSGGYDDSMANFETVVVPVVWTCIKRAVRAAVFGMPPNIWQFPPPNCMGGIFIPAPTGLNQWGWSNLIHCLFYGPVPNRGKGAYPTAIWRNSCAEETGHPTAKPLAWMTWVVQLASSANETILDPFSGSGTTLRAAKDLCRKSIGIELDEAYCEIAANRLSQEVLDL